MNGLTNSCLYGQDSLPGYVVSHVNFIHCFLYDLCTEESENRRYKFN